MPGELLVLTAVAASIGFVHTISGPDHYLPFVAMARARRWSLSRTASITLLCGVGHVAGSVLLGLVGVLLLARVERLMALESVRGELAAWGLIAFGLLYGAWGLRRAWCARRHVHLHAHGDGTVHRHAHGHLGEHVHAHPVEEGRSLTPWILFTLLVFGPCEPLIPLLMLPAMEYGATGVIWVAAVFGAVTVTTMLAVVVVALVGVRALPLGGLERYAHALAGAAVLSCGVGVKFFGL